MKARVGQVEVEGTVEEIRELIQSLASATGWSSKPDGGLQAQSGPDVTSSKSDYVSEEVAYRALKRRPLSKEPAAVLSLLRQNHPAWTIAEDIRKVIKYNPSEFAGLLGAFGKRISSTDGYVEYTDFFEKEWSQEHRCYRYRLPQSALSAVKRAGL